MSKAVQNPDDQEGVDNISSSRYISHMHLNGNGFHPPQISAEYVGNSGVLFRADCLDLLANIKDDCIDLAFVDPPFNLGKDYGAKDFSDEFLNAEAYRGWCRTWLLELVRVLRPGGALFLYHWPKWLMELGAWMNTLHPLEYKTWIALKMKNGFPIKGRIHPAHYGILYYVKRGAPSTFNVVRSKSPACRKCGVLLRDYGGYRGKFTKYEDEEGVPWIQISDFWEDTRPARHDKSRETQINELPLHVPDRAILMASKPGDIILDCFAGGGSTLHAAQKNGRYWIGGEFGKPLSALTRIATFFGKEETSHPPAKVQDCFLKKFRDVMLRVQPTNDDRPIKHVSSIPSVDDTMERYASKSKVLGF